MISNKILAISKNEFKKCLWFQNILMFWKNGHEFEKILQNEKDKGKKGMEEKKKRKRKPKIKT